MELDGKPATWIVPGIGAPTNMDVVLALGATSCRRILFIGSAGALDEKMELGDIVLPEKSICGDGASRYLQKDLAADPFAQAAYPDGTLLAQAESDARERIAQIQLEVEAAEDRLRQGQRELAQFIAATQSVCNKELEFLERLPQLPVEISAAAVPVQEIGTTVAASFEEKPPEEAAAAEPAAGIAVPPAGDLPAPQAPYPEGDPFTQDSKDPQDSMEVTRRIKFDKLDDLKFGPNYTGGT